MIVRTSAKSRLIRPGSVTRSEIPCTPWRSTSSATRNASTIETPRSSTDSSRLLGTTISVSTSSASAAIPASAWSRRREPSNWNGRVTIPTVSAPSSRAICATIGAAPVPVPPPAPAAMNTMSEPRSIALIWSYSSWAARRPRSGSEPEPEPAGDRIADVQRLVRGRLLKRLQVGVDRQELDPLDLGLDHPVDGVDAGATDADDSQHRSARPARSTRGRGRIGTRVHIGGRLGRATRRRLLARRRVEHVSGMSDENAWRRRSCGRRDAGAALVDLEARAGARASRPAGRAAAAGLDWGRSTGAAGSARPASACLRLAGRGVVLGGLAEQICERPLSHARALTGCHLRGPPWRAACRRVRPDRPDRTSARTCL